MSARCRAWCAPSRRRRRRPPQSERPRSRRSRNSCPHEPRASHRRASCMTGDVAFEWVDDVLRFWLKETRPTQWFEKDAAFDGEVRQRFLALHEDIAARPETALLVNARTALAAVIVLDQFSRNMFRGSPRAFATDRKALALAGAAVAQ